jgi:GNAT superfamily N-acetyltransferase
MTAPNTSTIEVRAVSGYDDLLRWVQVRNEVSPEDPEDPDLMAFIRASETEHVDLLALLEGEPAGTAMLAGDPSSMDSTHPWVEVAVLERHRGRGVGTALVRDVCARVRALGKEGITCEASGDDEYSLGYLQRREFDEVGRVHRLLLDLTRSDEPAPAPPEDVTLVSLAERPDLVEGMYAVARETYPELGGYIGVQAGTLQEWRLYELSNPSLALDATFIALHRAEVVGFVTAIRLPDRETVCIRMAAVQPAWRRRGVALALLRAQLAAARASGLRRAIAWQRTEAVAGLVDRLGFERSGSTVIFRGSLL